MISSKRRAWISAFIIFNILAILSGSSLPVVQQNSIQRFFSPYLVWTRLLQNWPLFVPTPRSHALKYRAEIILKDGQKRVWSRPYPPNWDFFERHLAYSFQKWDLASNYVERIPPLQRDLATYLQRVHWSEANPPQTISYIRSQAEWPAPRPSGYVGGDESDLQWTDHVVFTFHVSDQRLE